MKQRRKNNIKNLMNKFLSCALRMQDRFYRKLLLPSFKKIEVYIGLQIYSTVLVYHKRVSGE